MFTTNRLIPVLCSNIRMNVSNILFTTLIMLNVLNLLLCSTFAVEMMVLKVFRGYHGGFHPFCNPGGSSTSKSVASVFTNIEQPFACTEEPAEGDDKQVDFPLFQTVRCAFAGQDSTASPDPELVLFNKSDIYAHVDEGRE